MALKCGGPVGVGRTALRIPNKKIFAVIETIYRAPLDPGAWQGVIEEVRTLLPMTGASLQGFMAGSPPRAIGAFAGYDPRTVEEYVAHYAHRNALVPLIPKLQAGVPLVVDESPYRAQIHKTAFHGFLLRHEMGSGIGLPIWNDQGRMLVLTMDYAPRKGERLNGPAARLAQVLAPHLRRSFELAHQLAQSQSDAPTPVLGRMKAPTLVVDERRRLQYANPAAEALLGARSGLYLDKAGRIVLDDCAADVELERSVQACVRPELAGPLQHAICFRARGSEANQWISALPLTPDRASPKSDVVMFFSASSRLVMLIVSQAREPADDLAQVLRTTFGLTPAEIRLALALMQGVSLQEYAACNGVAVMTVRNQLQSIFGKTTTHRQAELTALLFGLPGNWTTRNAATGSVQSSASRPGGSTRTRLMLALLSVLNWCPWATDSFLAALV